MIYWYLVILVVIYELSPKICVGFKASFNIKSLSKKISINQNSGIHSELSIPQSFLIGTESSVELYACESGTQDLVIGQISNWIRAEIFTLKEFANYSMVLASIDGSRVVHLISWKAGNRGITNVFNNFRRRADGIDGTPAALKESTHLYKTIKSFPHNDQSIFNTASDSNESNPYISLDIFNNFNKDKQNDLINILQSVTTSPAQIPLVSIPEFKSMHLFSSFDSTVSILLGIWKGETGLNYLRTNENFDSIITKATKLSVRGTYTDLVEKTTDPSRLYFIADLYHSHLGIVKSLCKAIDGIGWKNPTEIQKLSIPEALEGKDIIGLAETGSGKTGAFAIPILQALLSTPQRLFAVVLAPTRELAFQINEVFEALGASIALSTTCIVGGIDMVTQAIALAKKPHVIVATPGRLVDHLQNTKGFNLRNLKYLVMDEADRMLSMDFEEEINKILAVIPRERRTCLFSATMTSKVAKLQKASLKDPVKVEVSNKFQTPKTLVQQYLFIPAKYKDCYLAYVLDEFKGQSVIIFAATCNNALRVTLLLRNLGFEAVCLHGQLSQAKRLGALNKFKAGQRNILVATDVASRGLDIPNVDMVINFDIPSHGKDYIHRVGRTARAGKAGRSIAFVTQYDVEAYQRLEALIGQKLPEFPAEESTVLILLERINEAQRLAVRELKEMQAQDPHNKKRKRNKDENSNGKDDTQETFENGPRSNDVTGIRKNPRTKTTKKYRK